jgi:hypothetical protein
MTEGREDRDLAALRRKLASLEADNIRLAEGKTTISGSSMSGHRWAINLLMKGGAGSAGERKSLQGILLYQSGRSEYQSPR